VKNRKREICTSGTVRDEDGNILIYSAADGGSRGECRWTGTPWSARKGAAVKKHPDYSEAGHFLAVEAAFQNWEAIQNVGH
jgi:hypothetical protein